MHAHMHSIRTCDDYTHMHILLIIMLSTQHPILFSEPVQQPQALSSDQPRLDVLPEFSKDMTSEQLSIWLTNHPQFVGADHQQDISKLKGML